MRFQSEAFAEFQALVASAFMYYYYPISDFFCDVLSRFRLFMMCHVNFHVFTMNNTFFFSLVMGV